MLNINDEIVKLEQERLDLIKKLVDVEISIKKLEDKIQYILYESGR